MRPSKNVRRRKMKTILLLAFALLTVLTPFAHASPPTTATGTFTASFTGSRRYYRWWQHDHHGQRDGDPHWQFRRNANRTRLRDNSSGRLIHRQRHRNIYWNIER